MKVVKCDICGKNISEGNELEIPIMYHNDGENYLGMHKFEDICDECYQEIGRTIAAKYYEMCKRNNNSGLHGISNGK